MSQFEFFSSFDIIRVLSFVIILVLEFCHNFNFGHQSSFWFFLLHILIFCHNLSFVTRAWMYCSSLNANSLMTYSPRFLSHFFSPIKFFLVYINLSKNIWETKKSCGKGNFLPYRDAALLYSLLHGPMATLALALALALACIYIILWIFLKRTASCTGAGNICLF